MSSRSTDAVVIGGGVAGCATAILLATRGVEVTLLEQKSYPRHKMCGEFLSPESREVFDRLGVTSQLMDAGARRVTRMRLTTGSGTELRHDLPAAGLALRRFALDAILFDRARDVGVTALADCAAREVKGSLDHGFIVATSESEISARLVIGAFGRQSALDRVLGRHRALQPSPYVAFKQYVASIGLGDCVELHATRGAYCGLIEVEDGSTNACWLVHQKILREWGSPEGSLRYIMRQNGALGEVLSDSRPITAQPIATSNLTFARRGACVRDVLMAGDAAGMISPLCGDGMAMALHGGRLAADLGLAYLEGEVSSGMLRSYYDREWRRHFSFRMRLGSVLQSLLMGPHAVSGTGVGTLARFPAMTRGLIRATRG